jgi:TPR repeat protein
MKTNPISSQLGRGCNILLTIAALTVTILESSPAADLTPNLSPGTATHEDCTNATSHWKYDDLKTASDAGNFAAQYTLGFYYSFYESVDLYGTKLLRDYARAESYWQKAAQQGHRYSQYSLGLLLAEGKRGEERSAEGVDLVRAVLTNGWPEAFHSLARFYELGIGEPRSPEETPFQLYRKAAEKDDVDACFALGSRYQRGLGIDRDLLQAVRWYRRAYQLDTNCLANRLIKSADNPTPQMLADPELRQLLRVVKLVDPSQADLPESQNELGELHLRGKWVPRNLPAAVDLFKKAARSGLPSAQLNLARVTRLPGEFQNRVESYNWYTLAGAKLPEALAERSQLEKLMSAEELNKARSSK